METFTNICLWVAFQQLSTHLQREESFKVVNKFLDWTTHPISFFMQLWYQSTGISKLCAVIECTRARQLEP